MKDIKIFIIGFLSAICIFFMMGQSEGNLGHIEVRSISVKNSNGVETAWIGSSTEGVGFLETYNASGKKTVYLGSGENGIGFMRTFNKEGTMTTYLGTGIGGFGFLQTFNSYEQGTSYIGTSKYNQGMVLINDKYGEPFWGEIAE